jgi:hypothetical protein
MSTTPRLARESVRGHGLDMANPLPATLAGLADVRERAEQHVRLAVRLAALRSTRAEVGRALVEQEAADERAAAEAALKGKAPGRRQKAASLRKKLEEVEDELRGFEDALPRSADNLFAAARPYIDAAEEKATEERNRRLERAREHQAALDSELEAASLLTGELAWLRAAAGRARVAPYRPADTDPGIRRLRGAVAGAFAEFSVRTEERSAEAERQRRWEEEHREEWARQREQAERQSREQRVTFEGPRLTHRGGRPLGPAGDFQDGEPERKR